MNILHWTRRVWVMPVRFYRRFISPWTPPTCRFDPTCSAYMEQAVMTHGVLKGLLLGIWRILRCHPFTSGGHEPVPPPGRWRTGP